MYNQTASCQSWMTVTEVYSVLKKNLVQVIWISLLPPHTGPLTQWGNTVMLHLLGYVSDDGFGARLKNQLPFDEGRHRVRGGDGSLLVRFYGYECNIIIVIVIVMAAQPILWMARMLGEDSQRFLQFDLLPVQNMMSYNQHWHPLVKGRRKTAEWNETDRYRERIGQGMKTKTFLLQKCIDVQNGMEGLIILMAAHQGF